MFSIRAFQKRVFKLYVILERSDIYLLVSHFDQMPASLPDSNLFMWQSFEAILHVKTKNLTMSPYRAKWLAWKVNETLNNQRSLLHFLPLPTDISILIGDKMYNFIHVLEILIPWVQVGYSIWVSVQLSAVRIGITMQSWCHKVFMFKVFLAR